MTQATVSRHIKIFFFCLTTVLTGTVNAQSLSGDTLVYAGTISIYRLEPTVNLVEWRVHPPGAADVFETAPGVVSLQINDRSGVRTFSLMASIPNLQGYFNVVKRLHIQHDSAPKTTTSAHRFGQDRHVSASIVCDSSRTLRTILLTDSTGINTKATSTWTILDAKGKRVAQLNSVSVRHRITPGSYTLRLNRELAGKTQQLTDTFTILHIPEYSCRAATAIICENAALAFSVQASHFNPMCQLTMHFGDGAQISVQTATSVVHHRYGMSGNIYQSHLQLRDSYGCEFNSPVTNLMVKKNTLQPTTVLIDPVMSSLAETNPASIRCTTTPHASQNLPLSYKWSTGDSTATIQVSKPGFYYVQVKDNIGCESPVLRARVMN